MGEARRRRGKPRPPQTTRRRSAALEAFRGLPPEMQTLEAFWQLPSEIQDELLEEVMQDAVKAGIIEETGEFDIGEDGFPKKRYRSLIYKGDRQ
jgi:hypothetical protein